MRKLKAYKRQHLSDPPEVRLRHNNKPVFHSIEVVDKEVETADGSVMIQVRIRGRCDFNDPDVDVAALVGQIIAYRGESVNHRSNLGTIDPQLPELWFWRDKFWTKAVDSLGVVYYQRKAYLFHEVDVEQDAILPKLDFE